MKTKSLLIGTAAAIALAAPADAAIFHGWYVGLEAGGSWIQDADDVVADGSPNFEVTFDAGWAGFATLGYSWSAFRAELELGYRANDIDSFFGGKGNPILDVGQFNEFSQMVNLIYDCDLGGWSFSFGAGAGGDQIYYENDLGHSIQIHDTDWVFAWQLLASLNYHISQRTDLFIGYRYFNAENPEFSEFGGETLHTDDYDTVHKHTATVGLRYALWGEEPVEVVAPPPPPPPPEPMAPPKEFIVFFGHNKTNLVAEAMKVVHEAAEAAKQYGSANVRVVGHADRSGSAKYNEGLSLRRADVVKGALVAEGIPAGAVSVSARGESEPLVPTADGVREPQNRRVNITM